MTQDQNFPLADVLYCVARVYGRRPALAGQLDTLHWFLTGESPSSRELLKFEQISVVCGLVALKQHPRLREIEYELPHLGHNNAAFDSQQADAAWRATQVAKYGAHVKLSPPSADQLRDLTARAYQIALQNLQATGTSSGS